MKGKKNMITAQELRRSGRTTRIADNVIQSLFSGYKVPVVDHTGGRNANEDLMRKVVRRLRAEHPHVMEKLYVGVSAGVPYLKIVNNEEYPNDFNLKKMEI